jgi:SET domain-containing protein
MKKRTNNSELKDLVYSAPSAIHGTGLFAGRAIRKDEYIGTYHGPVARRNGTYVLWVFDPDDPTDTYGISGRNLLRYLNHERPGNACFEGPDLFARRRIGAGEEITFDYGDEWQD